MPDHLFVYGTLRAASPHPLARRLMREARLIGEGTTPGQLYDLGTYPGASFDAGSKQHIVGDVFALKENHRLLALLDHYEGYSAADEANSLYRRIEVPVILSAGRTLGAWTYQLAAPPRSKRLIAGGDWILHTRLRSPRAKA